jgi:hypothetical protein
LSCLPAVYTKILENSPDAFQKLDWDFQRWKRTLQDSTGIGYGMYGNTMGGLSLLLQNAPPEFKCCTWQLYKSSLGQEDGYTSRPDREVIILLFEHMSEQEKEKALADLLSDVWDTWGDERVAKLTSLIARSWQRGTIWFVWQYIHQFDPAGEYSYPCYIWALALAPRIPKEYVSQAYILAFPKTWAPWNSEICTILALKLPSDFADTEWQKMGNIKERVKKSSTSGDLAYIDGMQKALVTSLSNEKLYSLMDEHRPGIRAIYKQITNPNLFAGNLLQYLRSIFSLLKSARAANTWWYDKITNMSPGKL